MSRTARALMARGVNGTKADSLAKAGWTVGKIKSASASKLQSLGLRPWEIATLRDGSRPPIPSPTLNALLFQNRYQCCVCRDPKLPIIVHHIVEWAKSKSHDIGNLAVLCLLHHDQAHTISRLSRNLTATDVREAKGKWEAEVKSLDARSIVEVLKADGSQWAYINELRVFELIGDYGIDVARSRYFTRAIRAGLVDTQGTPRRAAKNTFYNYEGPNILIKYAYMKDVLLMLVDELPISNISDYLDQGNLFPALVRGDFIFVEGAHTFARLTTKNRGMGQICSGKRSANGVEVRFTFDRWEATASSAWALWLSGTRSAGSLIHVKNLSREEGKLVIEGTVLAISSFTSQLKRRDYASTWANYRPKRRRRPLKVIQI